MCALRVVVLALAGAAALAVGGASGAVASPVPVPPPSAGTGGGNITSFGFTVTPERIAPGGTVTLGATECEAATVTASSGIFDPVILEEGLPGTATVFEDAKPGAEYEVVFDCQGERGTALVTVAPAEDAGAARPPGGTRTEAPGHRPPPEVKPGGGVTAGTGGSLPGGLDPVRAAAGSLLVAAAAGGAGVLLVRRRRTARNSG
jgi:hypothetical protein